MERLQDSLRNIPVDFIQNFTTVFNPCRVNKVCKAKRFYTNYLIQTMLKFSIYQSVMLAVITIVELQ